MRATSWVSHKKTSFKGETISYNKCQSPGELQRFGSFARLGEDEVPVARAEKAHEVEPAVQIHLLEQHE